MPTLRALGHATLPLALFLFTSCCCTKKYKEPIGYWGPTLPMSEVVRRVNQNASAIPTLYSRHSMDGDIYDAGRDRTISVNASGDLFLRKPRELLLRGRHDLAGKVFEIGSTSEQFWFTTYTGESVRYWGHYRNLGKPCMDEMPVRPDLIGEVLGLSDIPTNFLDPPFPSMRFNHQQDVYMLVWNARLPDRYYSQKEIWYDRKTFLPRAVMLYDLNGRLLVRAYLLRHQQIPIENKPPEQWPSIATEYRLLFPTASSTMSNMTIRLSDPALLSKAGHPRPGTIVFKDDPEVTNIIQVDEACER